MASVRLFVLVLIFAIVVACERAVPTSSSPPVDEWTTFTASGVTIRAVRADADLVPLVAGAIGDGERLATAFFGAAPLQPFTIAIYPDRSTLTDHWRVAWQLPSFQPQCWLIAAAWATELDLLSPRVWARDACGHDAGNQTHIRNVLAHEVVHVLHSQLGQHPNLASLVNVQWFFEGLAVYVSGMLDVDYAGIAQARLHAGFAPRTLAEVWNDQGNYPLSGSIVRYVDRRFGRAALRGLLDARSTATILARLGIGEAELLSGWRSDLVTPAATRD